ncbi:MAG: putative transposase [Mycobacterium sp.]|nr:putative transposase [Mycobacterium sp.]
MRHRDFSAHAPKVSWCGDITEIPTGEGKLTWPWCGTCSHASYWPVLPARTHPDAELACGAIEIATTVAVATPATEGVVLRTLRGSTFTARYFTVLAGVSGRVSRRAEWDRAC